MGSHRVGHQPLKWAPQQQNHYLHLHFRDQVPSWDFAQGLGSYFGSCTSSRWFCWKFIFNQKKAVQHNGLFKKQIFLSHWFSMYWWSKYKIEWVILQSLCISCITAHHCEFLFFSHVSFSFIHISSSANYVYCKLYIVSKHCKKLNTQQNTLKKNKCLTTGFKRFIKCHFL